MAGQGRPKTGGRQKGTLNKTSALLKDAVLSRTPLASSTAARIVGLLSEELSGCPAPL